MRTGLPAVRMGDPNRLKVGEWVVAIGSPFGFDSTVTAGIVSAKAQPAAGELCSLHQTDVAITGELRRTVDSTCAASRGNQFAIYSRTAVSWGCHSPSPSTSRWRCRASCASSGRWPRAGSGVVIQEGFQGLAESFGLSRPAGALVNQVEKRRPRRKRPGGGRRHHPQVRRQPVSNSGELPRIVGGTKPGEQSDPGSVAQGRDREITVTVGELPEDRVASRKRAPGKAPEQAANRLGFSVVDLTAEAKARLKVAGGVIVEDVRNNRRADVRAAT